MLKHEIFETTQKQQQIEQKDHENINKLGMLLMMIILKFTIL